MPRNAPKQHFPMSTNKALLIINPISGTRSKAGLADTVGRALAPLGCDLEVAETQYGGHARELAAAAAGAGCPLVLSAGGDGTVNEIATALAHTKTALGIIPLGSGNGLARSLNIPQDVDGALKVITGRNVVCCDRGIVNDTPFYCTFGIGFDAAISERFAKMKRRGRATYVKSVLLEFLKYRSKPYAISIGGNVITERAFLISVANAPQYGNNAYIAPQAKLADGLLDLVVIHDGSPLSAVKMGVDLLTGYLDRNTRIDSFRVSAATIARLDDGPVHIDGEPMSMGKTLNVGCDAGALLVCAPPQPDFKPLVSPLLSMISDIRYDLKARLKP